jgi:hypothetical protein
MRPAGRDNLGDILADITLSDVLEGDPGCGGHRCRRKLRSIIKNPDPRNPVPRRSMRRWPVRRGSTSKLVAAKFWPTGSSISCKKADGGEWP